MAALRLVPSSGPPIEISQDQVLIGREPTCDVVLNDGSVSRKHARLEKRGRVWTVVDQGSANGTFVDSQRIAETALRSGQEVRFGALAFRVEIEGEEPIGATILAEPADATVVQPASAAAPPPRPPAPVAPPRPPAPASPPPPPAVRVAVPPTGSIPPGELPPRASSAPRPPLPGRPAARPPLPPGEAAAPPRKGKGPLFWIATGCCGCFLLAMAIVALIGGAAFHMTSDAVAAVRAQLAELKSGNVDAAYQRLSDDYKARLSREEFEELVSQHPALKDNADSTFWKRSIENNRGEVSGVLTSTTGTREMVTYRLVKEGGVWKVSGIDFAAGGQSST